MHLAEHRAIDVYMNQTGPGWWLMTSRYIPTYRERVLKQKQIIRNSDYGDGEVCSNRGMRKFRENYGYLEVWWTVTLMTLVV